MVLVHQERSGVWSTWGTFLYGLYYKKLLRVRMKRYIWILVLFGVLPVLSATPHDRLFTKAVLAFNDSFYSTASRYLENYLREVTPGSLKEVKGQLLLAKSYAMQERYDALKSLVASFDDRELQKTPESAVLLQKVEFWKAYSEVKQGHYPAADIKLIGISSHPLSDELAIDALGALAESKFKQNNFPKSIFYYMQLSKRYGRTPAGKFARVETIKLFLLEKKFFWAEREIDKMIQEEKGSGEQSGQLLKLFLLTLKGESTEALILFEKLVVSKNNSRSHDWFLVTFYLAALQEKNKNFKKAAQLYARCLIYSVNIESSEKVMYKLAGCYIKSGDFDSAISSLEDYLSTYPRSNYRNEVKLSLVGLYKNKKRFPEALRMLSEILESENTPKADKFESQLMLADVYRDQGKTDESVEAYLKASSFAADENDKARSIYLAAEQSFNKNDFKQASHLYELLTTNYPRSAFVERALFSQGIALERSDELAKANKVFESFVVAYPTSPFLPNVIYRDAKAYQKQGQLEEAQKQFKKVFENYKSSPEAPKALLGYSDCLASLGIGGQGIPALEQGVIDFKESEFVGEIYEHLVFLLITFSRVEDGLGYADQFIQDFPTSPLAGNVLFRVANYWRNIGNDRNARREFLRLHEKFPKNKLATEAYLQAGLVSCRFDLARAEVILSDIVNNESYGTLIRSKAALALGNIEVERQAYDAAFKYFLFVEENSPEPRLVFVAKGRQADVSFLRSEYDEAIKIYQSLIINEKVDTEIREQARFKLGKILLEQNKDEDAEKIFNDLIYAYNADILNNEIRDWHYFTRTIFVLSDHYLAQERVKDALSVLERLEKLNLPLSDEARKRANALRKKIDF
jgi:TolA-binding protein